MMASELIEALQTAIDEHEIQHQRSLPVTEGLAVLSVVSAVLGVGVVADCIHQHELNKIDA